MVVDEMKISRMRIRDNPRDEKWAAITVLSLESRFSLRNVPVARCVSEATVK